jgi:hypothetical protein
MSTSMTILTRIQRHPYIIHPNDIYISNSPCSHRRLIGSKCEPIVILSKCLMSIYEQSTLTGRVKVDRSTLTMNEFELFIASPSLNLTVPNHHEQPIFTSTPLVVPEKDSSSTSSSFFLPLTENTQHSEQCIKLNEVCYIRIIHFQYIEQHDIDLLGSLSTWSARFRTDDNQYRSDAFGMSTIGEKLQQTST